MLYSKAYNIMPATPVQFGIGISDKLGAILAGMGCKNILLVTDNTILDLGVIDNALSSIREAGLSYTIYSDVAPNAPLSAVMGVVELLKSDAYDTILGAGGGSAMDVAKAGRLFESIPDAFTRCNLSAGGQYCFRQSKFRLVTLPTLSGSGCEYMVGAVITNDETHEKVTLAAGDLASDMAIIDPALQKNVPVSVTVASAVDAMCHAFNKICAPGCEFQYRNAMSMDAIKAIWNNLPVLVHDNSHDMEARSAICYGSIMSGYIGGGPNGNFNHPVAHTISRFFPSVPHGIACGWALPITLRHVLPDCSEWTRKELATLTGADENAEDLVNRITAEFIKWLKGVGFDSPSNWDDPISLEEWLNIAPYVKEDSTYGLNPFYAYPNDSEFSKYLYEAYYDFD